MRAPDPGLRGSAFESQNRASPILRRAVRMLSSSPCACKMRPMSDRDFEIYKLLVEEVRAVRDARRDISNMFTTLNLAGVGALGFLMTPTNGLDAVFVLWLTVALIFSCFIWMMSNAYYRSLLVVKYATIYSVEDSLGIKHLQREWKSLPKNVLGRWFSLERMMPALFLGGYAAFFVYRIGESAQGALQWIAEAWTLAAAWIMSFVQSFQ
jgi:hypothetical protein